MPRYLDRHKTMPMPPEMMADVQKQMGNKQPDGVTPVSFMAGTNMSYCLSDADSPESIHKHHMDMGIKLDEGAIEEITATMP